VDDSHTFFWLVGLCEGEAYFGLHRGTPVLEVECKDEHVIARIAAMFLMDYTRRDRRKGRPTHAVTFRVRMSGRRAMQVMKRLQPYMSPRRARRIQQIEDEYCSRNGGARDYNRIPLPPLVELPYTVESA